MAICTRHPFLHIYKVWDPFGSQLDVMPKLTEIEATFIISPRGVLQITLFRDFRTFIQRR